MTYYLFIRSGDSLEAYRREFMRVRESIERGITPVFCEMRSARTNLFESFPYNLLCGAFLVAGAFLLSRIEVNEIVKVALVLVTNSVFGAVANYVFTVAKHWLRVRLCARLGIEPSERNIAVMESLEYQSV